MAEPLGLLIIGLFVFVLLWWVSAVTKLRKENIEKRGSEKTDDKFREDSWEERLMKTGERFLKDKIWGKELKRKIICSKCDGKGETYYMGDYGLTAEDCSACRGEGIIGYIEDEEE